MKIFYATLCLSLTVVSSGPSKVKFSDLGQACRKSDKNFEECIRNTAGRDILPKFVKGIRSLGIFPIDPLSVPLTEIKQSDGPVGLKLNLTDSTHHGLRNVVFKDVRYSESGLDKQIEFHATLPNYTISATCQHGGKILLLPINGYGPCTFEAYGIDAVGIVKTKDVEKKGELHCEVQDVSFKLNFTGGSFKVLGLFNGNKELETTMNRFLNENGLEVLNELKPNIEGVWSAIGRNIVKQLFHKIPCNELILP